MHLIAQMKDKKFGMYIACLSQITTNHMRLGPKRNQVTLLEISEFNVSKLQLFIKFYANPIKLLT